MSMELDVVGYQDPDDGFLNKHCKEGYTVPVTPLDDAQRLLSQLREELAQRDAEVERLKGVLYQERIDADEQRQELEAAQQNLAGANAALESQQAASVGGEREAFQSRVLPWLLDCFGERIAGDTMERNHRFLEEALELVQACGCTADESHKLVDYVFGREVGERSQEVGGVMVTLAALCLAQNLDMHAAGETELARITQPAMAERIREKQKRKPAMSPLPGSYPERAALSPAGGGVVTREQAEQFLIAYHAEVWAAAEDEDSRVAYDEAGRSLAKEFLNRFGSAV